MSVLPVSVTCKYVVGDTLDLSKVKQNSSGYFIVFTQISNVWRVKFYKRNNIFTNLFAGLVVQSDFKLKFTMILFIIKLNCLLCTLVYENNKTI